MKTEGVGKKMKKMGKGEKEKGEKRIKNDLKRLKNGSLRVKNSKNVILRLGLQLFFLKVAQNFLISVNVGY